MRTENKPSRSISRRPDSNVVTAEAAYVAQARRHHVKFSNNEIEIDESPTVSIAHDGAWIAAWVWINSTEAGVRTGTGDRVEETRKKRAKSPA